jgi:uncharacterized membrane protein YhaH (DUF805 family)
MIPGFLTGGLSLLLFYERGGGLPKGLLLIAMTLLWTIVSARRLRDMGLPGWLPVLCAVIPILVVRWAIMHTEWVTPIVAVLTLPLFVFPSRSQRRDVGNRNGKRERTQP